MGRGYLPGRLTDLYRECYTDNSDQPEFSVYRDVNREAHRMNATVSENKHDSLTQRIRHFLKGLI